MDLDIFSVLSSGELDEFSVEGEDEVLEPIKYPKMKVPHGVSNESKTYLNLVNWLTNSTPPDSQHW